MRTWRIKTGKRKNKLNQPDEFLTFSEKVMDYIKANTNQVFIALGVIGVVVIILVGFGMMKESARRNVVSKSNEAFKYYDLTSPAPGDKPMDPVERLKKADELFGEVIKEHGSARGADIARYYKANTQMELGEVDKAIAGYSEIISKAADNPVLVSLATMRLAEAYLAKGSRQEAIDTFQKEIKSGSGLMKDAAHYRLAKIYESDGRTEDAKKEYQIILKDFPSSTYAEEIKAANAAQQPQAASTGTVSNGQAQPAQKK